MKDWTTAGEIRNRVAREWERGRLLAAPLLGDALYPLRIPLRGPTAAETLGTQFDAVRQWIKQLSEGAKTEHGSGYRLEFREVNNRQLGRNSVPVAAWLDTEEDALALIGKRREAAKFRELTLKICGAYPQLHDWIAKRALRVLEHADDWPRLLDVLRWISDHPRPNVYLRQIDAIGVHSKFIEQYRALLTELLDRILPPEAIDAAAGRGVEGFERRYGFRSKPIQIRFRLFSGQTELQGLSDICVRSDEFAKLAVAVQRVFITENEINFLALPLVPDSMVVFGAGYGFDALAQAKWLRDKAIFYWGDIDTHGFAILDQLRSHFPHTKSLLMDRETLLAHRLLCVEEEAPSRRDLVRLLPEEARLYDDLRNDRIGHALRLEQERIGFACVKSALGMFHT